MWLFLISEPGSQRIKGLMQIGLSHQLCEEVAGAVGDKSHVRWACEGAGSAGGNASTHRGAPHRGWMRCHNHCLYNDSLSIMKRVRWIHVLRVREDAVTCLIRDTGWRIVDQLSQQLHVNMWSCGPVLHQYHHSHTCLRGLMSAGGGDGGTDRTAALTTAQDLTADVSGNRYLKKDICTFLDSLWR